ncbi:hypothetical protein VTI28DRAFT_9774 [Corynascus sepedonium]
MFAHGVCGPSVTQRYPRCDAPGEHRPDRSYKYLFLTQVALFYSCVSFSGANRRTRRVGVRAWVTFFTPPSSLSPRQTVTQ